MSNYEDDYNKLYDYFEGKGLGVPYRGICDDIKSIVRVISEHIPKNDEKLNSFLIKSFLIYPYINSIEINGRSCSIEYIEFGEVKKICFDCIFFDDEYENMLYKYDELVNNGYNLIDVRNLVGKYRFSGNCHSATLEYLNKFKDNNVNAVTSLCVRSDNLFYFHSYILNNDNNKVIDLARNIIMDKEHFDFLYTYYQINSFSYDDYLNSISNSNYYNIGSNYQQLLYLALNSLKFKCDDGSSFSFKK